MYDFIFLKCTIKSKDAEKKQGKKKQRKKWKNSKHSRVDENLNIATIT